MDRKELQRLLFDIGTILELVTVFIYFIFRRAIIIYVGFPVALLFMLLGKVTFHKKTLHEKRLEQIELNDERNILIRDKAQSQTNLVMVYLLLATIIVLACLGLYNASVFVSIAVIIDSVLVRYFTHYYNRRL